MTTPSKDPTISDLYLAFRQAKTALYFERRGVGLLEIAKYEQKLPINLNALKARVASGKWFDEIEIGEIWVVPKRQHATDDNADGVVRIGVPKKATTARPLDIQLRLSPHPEFAIVEVLYLWRFGGILDALLSKKEVLAIGSTFGSSRSFRIVDGSSSIGRGDTKLSARRHLSPRRPRSMKGSRR